MNTEPDPDSARSSLCSDINRQVRRLLLIGMSQVQLAMLAIMVAFQMKG